MTNTLEKKVKKKGPIRFEAIIPVTIISLLSFVYFSFYFDLHLKNLFEYIGTQANGAEVNVGSVNTSFIKGSFSLNKLEVTDKEKPTQNLLQIGNVHFQYLWDALLRMKFVVEDASITDIQISSPRKSPGKVLPPEPAKPSKLNEIQNQVIAQVKNKYGANMLGDALSILEGGDYEAQVAKIRETLKSEARVKEMLADVEGKKQFWDGKVKELSDTSKLKSIEAQVQSISKEKNFLEQAKGVQKLTGLLKEAESQYKDVQSASKELQSQVNSVAQYPKELQNLVNEDIKSLKNHFSIPKLDFKEMAMHLFAGEFAQYITKARKYQALAKQYIPEKNEEQDVVIPRKRSEGKDYQFPITTGYPLFWLKRAALSSKGTADTYSGNIAGELTNVTNAPKQIGKPIVLDLKGDFPAVKVSGVHAKITIDFAHSTPKQSALIEVASFEVPEKLFVSNEKMKFGLEKAIGKARVEAQLVQEEVSMKWSALLSSPKFVVDTSNKLAKEMLTNVMNGIHAINIDASATGTFNNLNMNISSNLGDELSSGITREVGHKIAEAQKKIQNLIDEKINKPKEQLMAGLGGNQNNLSSLNNLQELYKKNEGKIKEEIAKLQKGGGGKDLDNLKDQGKKLLKGFKF